MLNTYMYQCLLAAPCGDDVHKIDWDVYSSIHNNAPSPSLWMKTSSLKSVSKTISGMN